MTEMHSRALVLTARPGRGDLTAGLIARARALIEPAALLQEDELAPGDAWQALFVAPAAVPLAALRAPFVAAFAGAPVDVNVIADDLAHRRKKLLVADMDSTIIEQECIDEIADVLGLKARIAAITERAMRGELPFEAALTERLALLAGIGEDDLDRVYRERLTLMPGARTLIATMKADGAFTALVSGGFTYFTGRIRRRVGFDVDHANTLEVAGGRMTGRPVLPILGREAKLATLERYRIERGLAPALTLAVGDGANDLAMIKAAGLGVAYRAKPVVAAEAHAGIVHGDLTALLFLQGYRRSDFATVDDEA